MGNATGWKVRPVMYITFIKTVASCLALNVDQFKLGKRDSMYIFNIGPPTLSETDGERT